MSCYLAIDLGTDLLPALGFTLAALAPLCLVQGAQFVWASRAWRRAGEKAEASQALGRGYALETAGFVAGGLLPVVAILLAPIAIRVPVTFVIVLVALAITGALGARMGGAPALRAALRVTIGGALGLALTYGIGSLFGTQVG